VISAVCKNIKFVVLTVATVKGTVFSSLTPYSLINLYLCVFCLLTASLPFLPFDPEE
jgi:hypothetical protein